MYTFVHKSDHKKGGKGGIIIFKGVSCPQVPMVVAVCNAINVTCKTCKSNLQLNKKNTQTATPPPPNAGGVPITFPS